MTTSDRDTSIVLAHEPGFRLGRIEVRPATREVVADGFREVLEPRVMQVLVALAHAKGEVLSRDDLTQSCWGGRVVGEDSINRVIGRLRRLAAHDDHASFSLETVRKVGYRLITFEGRMAVALPAATSRPAMLPMRQAIAAVWPRNRAAAMLWLSAALFAAALALTFASFALPPQGPRTQSPSILTQSEAPASAALEPVVTALRAVVTSESPPAAVAPVSAAAGIEDQAAACTTGLI